MSWVELAVVLSIVLVFYHLHQFLVAPPPKPRWKAMFMAGSIVTLSALMRVFRTDAPDAWAFLIFGTVGMIVAVLVIMPRDKGMAR